jgi:hypothetical protein
VEFAVDRGDEFVALLHRARDQAAHARFGVAQIAFDPRPARAQGTDHTGQIVADGGDDSDSGDDDTSLHRFWEADGKRWEIGPGVAGGGGQKAA